MAEDKAKNRERVRLWNERNPGKAVERTRRWQLNHPEKYRASYWRNRGIDPIAAEAAWLSRDRCAICSRTKEQIRLCVDHDHTAGVVRGILCFACNTAIGKLGDNLEGVMRAVAYLTKPLDPQSRTA